MADSRRRAKKLSSDLLSNGSLAPGGSPFVGSAAARGCEGLVGESITAVSAPGPIIDGQQLLFKKGSATASGFRPSHWSYQLTRANQRNEAAPTIKLEAPATPATAPLPEKNPRASAPTDVAVGAQCLEHRALQQALAVGLTEIIDGILSTRQFAARGIHESFRKRMTASTLRIEQFASTQEIANSLTAELARAKVPLEANVRLAKPLINMVLDFIGFGGSGAAITGSSPARDQS